MAGTPLPALAGMNKRWSERKQAVWITWMVENDATPGQAYREQQGQPKKDIVSKSTLRRWLNHFSWWGETPRATQKRLREKNYRVGENKMTPAMKEYLKYIVDLDPALFLCEMRDKLYAQSNVRFSISCIHKTLTSRKRPDGTGGLGYSLKLLTFKAARACREERAIYCTRLRQVNDPSCLIFVDESSVDEKASRRRRGYGKRGLPLARSMVLDSDSGSRGVNPFTLIAAVDINGFVLSACERIERRRSPTDNDPTRGTVDGVRFYQSVVTRLVPVLGNRVFAQPRSTVVMDNATIHKHPGVVEAIYSAGAELIWNAAYSPDLNPIERCFSYYKSFLRREMWAFRRYPEMISFAALANCVDRKTMCNLYNGKALDGCIRNVPEDEDEEERALILALLVYYVFCLSPLNRF